MSNINIPPNSINYYNNPNQYFIHNQNSYNQNINNFQNIPPPVAPAQYNYTHNNYAPNYQTHIQSPITDITHNININRSYNYQENRNLYNEKHTNITNNETNFTKELKFIIDNYPNQRLPPNIIKRTKGEIFKDEFFKKNPISCIKHQKISIPEFRSKLEKIKNLNEKLKEKVENGLLEEGQLIKGEIDKLKSEITPEIIEKVKCKIRKINSKRKRIKQVKIKMHSTRKEEESARKAMHDDIDEKIKNIQSKSEKKQKTKEMKESTDKVLTSVIAKIHEVNISLETYDMLLELRDLNKISDLSKGIICTVAEDTLFSSRINYMKELCNTQLTLYENQKGILEVLIEKERLQDIDYKQDIIYKKKLSEMKEVLFGGERDKSEKQSVKDEATEIKNHINTRIEWDLYLTNDVDDISQRVPLHYIAPDEPSSDIWKQYLKQT